MTLRIAVLNNNIDRSAFAQRFGNDGLKVVAGLQPWRPSWQFEVWHASACELPPDPGNFDGWVLTGSVSSVNEGAPWMLALASLVQRLHAQRAPLVGLCFGHQMVAHALGGRIGPSAGGWRVGAAQTHFREQLPCMVPAQSPLRLFAAHQDQVLQVPPGARVLGGDDWTPNASLAVGDHIFTTQYHPELSLEFMRALLDEHPHLWSPDQVARAREQIEQPVHATGFMGWIAQFLEQPRSAATP